MRNGTAPLSVSGRRQLAVYGGYTQCVGFPEPFFFWEPSRCPVVLWNDSDALHRASRFEDRRLGASNMATRLRPRTLRPPVIPS